MNDETRIYHNPRIEIAAELVAAMIQHSGYNCIDDSKNKPEHEKKIDENREISELKRVKHAFYLADMIIEKGRNFDEKV